MPTPRSKEEALKQMRLMWLSLLIAEVLYVYIGETEPMQSWLNFRHAGETFAALAVLNMWTVLLCNASSLTLFGLAFRMVGKTLQQSLPFYLAGVLLTLGLWPRQVWSSTGIAPQ